MDREIVMRRVIALGFAIFFMVNVITHSSHMAGVSAITFMLGGFALVLAKKIADNDI